MTKPRVVIVGGGFGGLHAIEAELSPRNVKSLKLLEKNGFTIKTEFNNGNPDSVIYALENTGREKDT